MVAQERGMKAGAEISFATANRLLNWAAQLSLNLDKLLVSRFIAKGSGSMIRGLSLW